MLTTYYLYQGVLRALWMHLKINHFKIKVTVTILFYLGFDLFRDSNGVLCFYPHKYIDNMFQTYMNMFGTNPILHNSDRAFLEQGEHTDIDTS